MPVVNRKTMNKSSSAKETGKVTTYQKKYDVAVPASKKTVKAKVVQAARNGQGGR